MSNGALDRFCWNEMEHGSGIARCVGRVGRYEDVHRCAAARDDAEDWEERRLHVTSSDSNFAFFETAGFENPVDQTRASATRPDKADFLVIGSTALAAPGATVDIVS